MLSETDYEAHDAVGLSGLIRDGEATAAELLEIAIARTERLDPILNAVIVKAYEEARREAREVSSENGPLAGVPFLIKNYSPVKGLPHNHCSRLFRGEIAAQDSNAVKRFREAGLVLFGKTNTPELCLTITTESRLEGPCRNPWKLDYSTGGSSGGAAAAVAAGIVPAAHGTDGGGSIRVPASCCGLFGLKPSRGLTVSENALSGSWSGMSVGHVLTRSVRDSAAFLDVLRLRQPQLYPLPAYGESYFGSCSRDPGKLRIAMQLEHPAGAPVDPECRAAVEAAAALCSKLGSTVEAVAPPIDYEALTAATITIINVHVAQVVFPQLEKLNMELQDSPLEEATRRMAGSGARVSAGSYIAALDTLKQIEVQMAAFHQRFDVLLSPVLSLPPAKLGWLDMNSDDMKTYARRYGAYAGFPSLFNATGQPSVSMPLHLGEAGLPIGVMFSAAWGQDHLLLQLGAQLEQLAPWFARRPPPIPA